MLYLIDSEQVLQPCETLSEEVIRDVCSSFSLPWVKTCACMLQFIDHDLQIFGATQEDVQKLKIVSIQEVDIDVLDSMIGAPDDV